jgi:hypothetical protein
MASSNVIPKWPGMLNILVLIMVSAPGSTQKTAKVVKIDDFWGVARCGVLPHEPLLYAKELFSC